jgi:membrane protein implicated in regulation of membrane protease activity
VPIRTLIGLFLLAGLLVPFLKLYLATSWWIAGVVAPVILLLLWVVNKFRSRKVKPSKPAATEIPPGPNSQL